MGAASTYKHYWTQLFADSAGSADQGCLSGTGGSAPGFSQPDAGRGSPNGGGGTAGNIGRIGRGADSDVGSGVGACEDKDQNCAGYAKSYCQAPSPYAPFMADNCAK